MKRRQIVYISGTRADFGLMRRALEAIHAEPCLALSVVATGMHLSAAHGETIHEIEASGLPVLARVPFDMEPATGLMMAQGIATMIAAFTEILASERPDIVLLLGDRGEMLAGAIAALHLNIAVAHIHGGERSGTVDEPVRHAISKLSHIHLTATANARERLVRMGEDPGRIHTVGAPGLDGLTERVYTPRHAVAARYGLDPALPLALVVYHPVLQDAEVAGREAGMLLDAVLAAGAQALVLMPNADAGSDGVREQFEARRGDAGVMLVTHLERNAFLDAMAIVDVMVGNSSAGIIEAASFGTPVVNVGTRQNLRERNANIVDVSINFGAIVDAINMALATGRLTPGNIYGDGHSAPRIVAILQNTPLDKRLMMKVNDY